MNAIIKSALIFIRNNIQNINSMKAGFTLLEIILVIIIIELLTVSSFTFIRSFLNFYSNQDSNILSTTDEKTGLLIFSNDIFPAENITIFENEISFDSYYKGEEKSLTYKVYDSSSGMALGKITKENISAVINNVDNIKFTKEGDLLLVDLLFINSNNDTRHVKRIFKTRIK